MVVKNQRTSLAKPTRALYVFQAVGLAFSLTAAMVAKADDALQPASTIQDTAAAFIAQQVARSFPRHEITVSDLDPRLTLNACDAPLEALLPPGARLIGNTSVGVRCPGSKPWTVFLTAHVTVFSQMAVTRRPILRGTIITEADLALEEREITSAPDTFIADLSHALGKAAKRTLGAATPLSPDMLAAPLLVKRGQQVTIQAVADGIEVRFTGVALMDGSEGQVIRAQTKGSKRTVEGLIIAPGILQVNI